MRERLFRTEISKAVLITGCSSGIGKATALRLARSREKQGWTIWATARNKDSLHELEAAGCQVLDLDVNVEASMEEAVRTVEKAHGAVGVLINNAGYAQSGPIETVPIERVRNQFETNVFGMVRLTQRVLPRMRAQRWGRIINLGSMGGKLVFPGAGYYHGTKYAVEALSDALRFEVKGFGIRVVLIQPGLIRSGFVDAALTHVAGNVENEYHAFDQAVTKATVEMYEKGPMSRLVGSPEDVAAVIERAITADRPRARYTVSGSAKVMLALRAVLSDRLWDAFMAMNFPKPGTALQGKA